MQGSLCNIALDHGGNSEDGFVFWRSVVMVQQGVDLGNWHMGENGAWYACFSFPPSPFPFPQDACGCVVIVWIAKGFQCQAILSHYTVNCVGDLLVKVDSKGLRSEAMDARLTQLSTKEST